jgi:hypothetical protein
MYRANQAGFGMSPPAELRDALDGWRQGTGPLHRRLAAALAGAA